MTRDATKRQPDMEFAGAETEAHQAKIKCEVFHLTLMRLREQHDNWRRLDPSSPELIKEAVVESVIRRFQKCHDCMLRVLKRHLVKALGIPDPPCCPKPVLRCAFENHLLDGSVERWLGYAEHRARTSRGYGPSEARSCLGAIAGFVDDAVVLYETMTGEPWLPSATP